MTDQTNVGAIRVFIVDDHAIVRDGIRSLLATEPGIEVVGEAENGRDAVSKAQPTSMIHEITKEHLAITRALLDGDPDEVRRTVHQHLINAEARTLHEISDKLNPSIVAQH